MALVREYSKRANWYSSIGTATPDRVFDDTSVLPPNSRAGSAIRMILPDGVRGSVSGYTDPADVERVQLQHDSIITNEGTHWFAWWDNFDADYPISTTFDLWNLMWEIHPPSGNVSNNLSIWQVSGQRHLVSVVSGWTRRIHASWPINFTKWAYFRLGWKQTSSTTGWYRLYRTVDGVNETLVSLDNMKTSVDTQTYYPIIGTYRHTSINGTARMRIADMAYYSSDPGPPSGGTTPPPPASIGTPPHAAGVRIGRISSGGFQTSEGNSMRMSLFNVDRPVRIFALVVPTRGKNAGSGTQRHYGFIMTPGATFDASTLLGQTQNADIAFNAAPAYTVMNFSSPLDLLTAGNRWFGVATEPGSGGADVVDYGISTGATIAWARFAPPGVPTTFGDEASGVIGTDATVGLDIYAYVSDLSQSSISGQLIVEDEISLIQFTAVQTPAIPPTGSNIPAGEVVRIPHGPIRSTQGSRPQWNGKWLYWRIGYGWDFDPDQSDWS